MNPPPRGRRRRQRAVRDTILEIDERDIGAEVPVADQPLWLQQFALFLRVNALDARVAAPLAGGLLLRCRVCPLSLGVPPDFDHKRNPTTILHLAKHGMEHAASGDLRDLHVPEGVAATRRWHV